MVPTPRDLLLLAHMITVDGRASGPA